jgi:ferric-dicitrate binding protein FerR (iron transport regulator)
MSLKRPPVEPLSRPAWDRVEAGVFARLDRGEHLLPSVDHDAPSFGHAPFGLAAIGPARRWVLGGALAAAASLALFWRFGPAHDEAAPNLDVAQAVSAPAAPRHEARIVSTDAPTETTIGEAVITLAAHSDVAVAGSDADGWLVRLDAGQVDCKVAPRRGRPPFVVQAGEAKVSVVGTRFTVTREGSTARVSVSEGKVQVDSGSTHVLLGPGDSWPGSEPEATPAVAPVEPEHADEPAPGETVRGKRAAYVVAPRAQQRFERAARLEAKDPKAALSIYQQLARGKGPWAANALYAQARLELERGRPQRAEPLLRRYLERHPQGMNAGDVRKLLAQIEQ